MLVCRSKVWPQSNKEVIRPMMNDEILQQWVEKVSLEEFGKPFRHQARFNRRLRTTGGRYCLHNHSIEINPKFLEQMGEEVVLGIIRHELCHYHLHLEGKGYRHRDPEFRALLTKVKGLRYAPTLPENKALAKIYFYQCIDCGQTYQRRRKVNLDRYRCGKCHGQLIVEPRER